MIDTRLHQSLATVLCKESPLHAWYRMTHPEEQKPTETTDVGTIAHELILGGSDKLEIMDLSQFRTKDGKPAKNFQCAEAREARDAFIAAGKIPLTVEQAAPVAQLVETVGQFLVANDLALTGHSELEVEWTEDGVECAGRLDHFMPDRALILDLKFVRSANPAYLPRAVIDFGYDIQEAAYISAMSHLRPDLAGRIDFIFIFAEKEPPFAITPARLAGSMKALGVSRWARAIDTWRHCMAEYGIEKPWPGYAPDGFERIICPQYAMAAESEINLEFAAKLEAGI